MINFNTLVWSWIIIGVITFFILVLSGIKAPYGRHSSTGWGKMIENKWGWFLMEMPAFLLFPALSILGPSEKTPLLWLLVILWVAHYAYRTLIFPFKIKTKGKKMPILIMIFALIFNGVNGFINGYFLGFLSEGGGDLISVNVILGLLLFIVGMGINRLSDNKLISLRNGNEGYKIPRGGLFEYISCPNHFGEILGWTGFALVAWNLPALSFAIWTFCNLVPRTLNHHDWYQKTFENYPIKRKAVIPFIW